jgi:hypothetical protein
MISRNGKRIIKATCSPGTIIIEIPDDGKIQLGEQVQVTGAIQVESVESLNPHM